MSQYSARVEFVNESIASQMSEYERNALTKLGFEHAKRKYEALGGRIKQELIQQKQQAEVPSELKQIKAQTLDEIKSHYISDVKKSELERLRDSINIAINAQDREKVLLHKIMELEIELAGSKEIIKNQEKKMRIKDNNAKTMREMLDHELNEKKVLKYKMNQEKLQMKTEYIKWVEDLENQVNDHFEFELYLKKQIENEMNLNIELSKELQKEKNLNKSYEKTLRDERKKKEQYKLSMIEAVSVAKESHKANVEKRAKIEKLTSDVKKATNAAKDAIEAAHILSQSPGTLEIEASDGLLSDSNIIRLTKSADAQSIKEANDLIFDRLTRRYSRVGILVRRNALLRKTVEELEAEKPTFEFKSNERIEYEDSLKAIELGTNSELSIARVRSPPEFF